MKRVLLISNCAISKSESNGRISSFTIKSENPNTLYNFYLRGCPDFDGCKYFTISPKKAILSKISFGIMKSNFSIPKNDENILLSLNPKSSKPFYHLLRSFAYIRNFSILRRLTKFVKSADIDTIYLWGSNVPFLYYYAWKLQKKCGVQLITYTSEDYPLKSYNFINNKHSFLAFLLRKSLRKQCSKVYKRSKKNIYSTNELKELYENELNISSGIVEYLKSELERVYFDKKVKDIKNILYAGNLYNDRVKSLCDVAEYLKKYEDITINVYGNGSSECIEQLKQYKNIHYGGVVPFNDLIDKIYTSDLLLHVEGFSDEYMKDCRYAFSTKIADYFVTGIPFFVYGPKEISGIKFCYNLIGEFVACDKKELSNLDKIISGKQEYRLDYNVVKSLFSE